MVLQHNLLKILEEPHIVTGIMVQGISGKSLRAEPGAETHTDMGSKGGDLCRVFSDTTVRFLTGYQYA